MEVTDVRLNLVKDMGGVKAIGSFALDGEFAVRGVRVMEDMKGHNFVAFPSREKKNGDYEDVAFALTKELYHAITEAILKEYELVKEQKETEEQTESKSEEAAKDEKAKQDAAETEEAPKRGRSK